VWGEGLIGVEWGIGGLCSGPAFSVLLLGRWETHVFFTAMIAGMLTHAVLQRPPQR